MIIHRAFHNYDLGANILTMKDADGNPLFECKDLATVPGYEKPKDAIRGHIFPEDKVSFED